MAFRQISRGIAHLPASFWQLLRVRTGGTSAKGLRVHPLVFDVTAVELTETHLASYELWLLQCDNQLGLSPLCNTIKVGFP